MEPPPRPPGPRRSAPAQRPLNAARDIPRHAPARGRRSPSSSSSSSLLLLGERLSAGVSDLPPPPPPPPAGAPGRAGSAGGAHGRAAGLPRTRVGPAGRHSIAGSRGEPRPRRRAPAPALRGRAAARGGGGEAPASSPSSLAGFFFPFASALAARGAERSRIGASASRLPQASSPAIHSCTRGSASPGARGGAGGLPLRSPQRRQRQRGQTLRELAGSPSVPPGEPRRLPAHGAPHARGSRGPGGGTGGGSAPPPPPRPPSFAQCHPSPCISLLNCSC
ncbi:uncharacterized protein LOC141731384 [Zonotrichia albicollis]|uniref:uncharacterized protein LOC141731384 n=1 Tax=Zonotrichia albicollis TaxID=44394 RepID=UPI003D80F239